MQPSYYRKFLHPSDTTGVNVDPSLFSKYINSILHLSYYCTCNSCCNVCSNCCCSIFPSTVAATVAELLQQFVVNAIIIVATSCLLLDLCFKLQHLLQQLLKQFCVALVGIRSNKISCTLSNAMRKVSIVLRLNVVHK